ncbi:MAG: hypothetical protein HY719_08155 [Planctomycetes bacterium]|nr:hypothetical protein [Planctomycetota bacterium]
MRCSALHGPPALRLRGVFAFAWLLPLTSTGCAFFADEPRSATASAAPTEPTTPLQPAAALTAASPGGPTPATAASQTPAAPNAAASPAGATSANAGAISRLPTAPGAGGDLAPEGQVVIRRKGDGAPPPGLGAGAGGAFSAPTKSAGGGAPARGAGDSAAGAAPAGTQATPRASGGIDETWTALLSALEAKAKAKPGVGGEAVATADDLRRLVPLLIAERRFQDALVHLDGETLRPFRRSDWHDAYLYLALQGLGEHKDAEQPLERLRSRLDESIPLEVQNLTVCEAGSIQGFGKFTPLRPPVVRPGETMALYLEVFNLRRAVSDSGGGGKINLELDVEVQDAEHRPASWNARARKATIGNRAYDVPTTFEWETPTRHQPIRYALDIPSANVQPGDYRLLLTARDRNRRTNNVVTVYTSFSVK